MSKIHITALAESQGRITIRLSNNQNLLLPDQREGTREVMRSLSSINLGQLKFDSLNILHRNLIFVGTAQGDLILTLAEPVNTIPPTYQSPSLTRPTSIDEKRRLFQQMYDKPSYTDPNGQH
jgi:hypothetical protein